MSAPDDVAGRFVAERFPDAQAAFLAGSAGTSLATASSDLDVVVVGEPGGPVLRETLRYAGWPVEVFLHTPASMVEFVEREIATRRSPLLHMCAEGRLLLDVDGCGVRIQEDARRRLAAGPPPLSPGEDEDRRYRITDLLDDLSDARDRTSVAFVSARLLEEIAELVLTQDRQWLSRGKWLGRRLASLAPQLCNELVTSAASVDPMVLHTRGSAILDTRGGRVGAGYRRIARHRSGT
ncbi:nucleotidyltransferase domain-containing protein [Pseudonocardia sp. TRM90224]|uniref:nucleotidyltransferase domain-containing protein n=1 Tax=Pseudonocardia sp. TRM90224 TaxID=2812678 RepID=UPI001E629822|nr:nucleotidyltransferase domain-containing protein [Pseudonocardia sp. TRM90224]